MWLGVRLCPDPGAVGQFVESLWRQAHKRKFNGSRIIVVTTFMLWSSMVYHAIRNFNNFDFDPYHGQAVASHWVFWGGAITAIPFTMFFTHFFGSRFFCKYVCPVGGFQSYYSKFSLLKIKIDKSKCNDCEVCANACQMGVRISSYTDNEKATSIRDKNCILCGDCVDACPQDSLSFGWEGYLQPKMIKMEASSQR